MYQLELMVMVVMVLRVELYMRELLLQRDEKKSKKKKKKKKKKVRPPITYVSMPSKKVYRVTKQSNIWRLAPTCIHQPRKAN